MAANNVAPTYSISEGGRKVVKWPAMIADSTGGAISLPGYRLESIQALGTFDTSGKVLLEGSNDGGTTYAPILDKAGTPASVEFSAAALKFPAGDAEQLRVRTTANGAGSAINVDVHAYFLPRV